MPAARPARPHPKPLAEESLSAIAQKLRNAKNPLVLLGGVATDRRGLLDGARLAEAAGGALLFEQFPRCTPRAPGLPSPERLGYIPVQARMQLAAYDVVAVFGADPPAIYFGYAGEAPKLTAPETEVLNPAAGGRDVHEALAALCERLEAPARPKLVAAKQEYAEATGSLQPQTICQTLARLLPENAIVVDEGITSTLPLYPTLTGAVPHDYMACKGASIGYGTPVATGAAVAAPGRRVVAYVGDGSAAYTIQSLWTQARESLDVTTIILQNDKYAVLQMELLRSGGSLEGAGQSLTEIGNPSMDFAAMAKGFGVPSRAVRDVAEFTAALKESFATPGPMLIACVFG